MTHQHTEPEEPKIYTSVGECDEEIARLELLWEATPTKAIYNQIKTVAIRANELARANGWTRRKQRYNF